ncbi:MAG: peptide chain release factor N(5)-glutamine methyltransferase [Alistipes sp.]|nr:peptide chain release factor N(5)-glutamine methyltransferase [Alistipes sp.]
MRASRAEIVGYITDRIASLYPESECRHIARMVAAALSHEAESKYLIEPNETIEIEDLERCAEELACGRPVQYVIGRADFCGEEFIVREGVLIPRPETEELVMWAMECAEGINGANILDVCTGSGCIAISLKKRLRGATVTAIDLSDEALCIARENAEKLNAEVEFIKDDALKGLGLVDGRKFDIIVSNPPYIPQSEISAMHINVTGHEPHMALFIDDNDPLIFYREIARVAKKALSKSGFLLFEIHETLATQTAEMLSREGFHNIEIRNDFRLKPRMICCRPSQK